MAVHYPEKLLPNRRNKKIKLNDWANEMYVIRFAFNDTSIDTKDKLKDEIALHFKDSTWFDGISVSLCGLYRKKDVAYSFKAYKKKQYAKPWKEGTKVKPPKEKHVIFNKSRGFFGLKIASVRSIEFVYTFDIGQGANKKKRTDNCRLDFEHAPTRSNFWHFNIWIYSENQNTKKTFTNQVGPDELPSKSDMKRRAIAAIGFLKDIVLMPNEFEETVIAPSHYLLLNKSKRKVSK